MQFTVGEPAGMTADILQQPVSAPLAPVVASARDERSFHTLDGLRGVAALAVAVIHITGFTHRNFLGGRHIVFGGLAVDFFFVLSGFVIAHAYGRKLTQGMGLGGFLRVRIIRLWPLYVLAIAIAVAQFGVERWLTPNVWTWKSLGLVALTSLVMIPAPLFGFNNEPMFLLNPATWSLAAEMIVNTIYAAMARHLGGARLLILCAIAGGVLLWRFLHHHGGSIGVEWSGLDIALARAAYGFFMGVLIYRLHESRPCRFALNGWLLIVPLAVMLLGPTDPGWRPWYEPISALLVFPMIVYVGASSRLDAVSRRICLFFGGISYALYVLHSPLGRTAEWTAGLLHQSLSSDLADFGLLAAFVIAAFVADIVYDQPVRKALTRMFGGKRMRLEPAALNAPPG